jgi:hypothetical protein
MKDLRLDLTILFSFILIFSVSFSPACESVAPINVKILGDDSYEYEIIEGLAQVILDGSNLAADAGPSEWKWIIRVNTGDDDWKTYGVGSGEILTENLGPGNYSVTLFITYDDFNDVDIFTTDLSINAGPNYFEEDDDDYDDDKAETDDDEDDDNEEIDDNDDDNDDEMDNGDDDDDDEEIDDNNDDDEDDEDDDDENDEDSDDVNNNDKDDDSENEDADDDNNDKDDNDDDDDDDDDED